MSAAAGPIDITDVHAKGGGYRYIPVTCGTANTWAIDCSGGQVLQTVKEMDPENAEVDTGSFVVYSSLECGAVGYTSQEFKDKVERRLLNGEQGAAEYALWTGLGADGTPLGIENLTDSGQTVTPGDPSSLPSVISALEEYAYLTQGYGNIAYIHAPVSVSSWTGNHYLFVQKGGITYTPYGSIWIFGGGYPGTGPGGVAPPLGGAYIYITGQTTVWRSPDIFTYPVEQTMDRTNNQHHLLSEREYAIGFDCFAGRALYDPVGA